MKKLILGIVLGMVLMSVIVIGANEVPKEIIQKVNGVVYIYNLVGTYTDNSIKESKDKLDKEIKDLNNFIKTLPNDCSYCIYETEQGIWKDEEECINNCNKYGSWLTESEKMYFESQIVEKENEKIELDKLKEKR